MTVMKRTLILVGVVGLILILIGLAWRRAAAPLGPTAAQPPDRSDQTAAPQPRFQPAGMDSADPDAPSPSPIVAPAALATGIGENDIRRQFPGAVTLAQRETATAVPGVIVRERLLRVPDLKYPLLSVTETVAPDPATGHAVIRRRETTVADHLVVKVRPEAEADFAAAVARWGGQIRKKLYRPHLYLVAFPEPTLDTVPQAIARLQAEADVVTLACADQVVQALDLFPNDPNFNLLYGLHNTGQIIQNQAGTEDADVDAPTAWDRTTGSAEVIVAVIDTGVDYQHPDLNANMWRNPGEIPGNGLDDDGNGFADDVYGYDFYTDDPDPFDDHYHGTHCAGTIGAVGNNGVGLAGVAWTVRLMALKFLSAGGSGFSSDGADAIHYATRMGAWLSSNSWGGEGVDPSLADAIGEAGQSNILFVAAAGNSGRDIDVAPTYPAAFTNDNLISVAATDNRDQKASWSNYGAQGVDLGAPGVNIWSCQPGNKYQYLSGTSMATPHVAGACALAWAASPNSPAPLIKQAILAGVDPLPNLAGLCVTGGRLNVYEAIRRLGLAVIGSEPAAGAILFTPPTAFRIVLTDAVTTNSVDAADLTVNGIPADSVTLDTPRSAIFEFLTSPVTAQGTQTMAIAENSFQRAYDGDGVSAWTGVFRYDVIGLTVTNTEPADGAVVSMPISAITVHFNEPVAPASVSPAALQLDRGEVTGVTIVDADTLTFAITNLVSEGTLHLTIPAGALTDDFGNPNLAYHGTLEPDFGALVPFPGLWQGRDPAGSLIYSAATGGGIMPVGDTDGFTVALDAGQTLTIIATPAETDGLQPELELRDPSNTVLGTAAAAAPGAPALLQTAPVATAGLYRVTVAGGSTSGGYTLTLVLNAAAETETHGGPANDTAATAQDLAASFTTLTGSATRGAVVGQLGGTDTADWYTFSVGAAEPVTLVSVGADQLELYDAADQRLAVGVADQPGQLAIEDVRLPAAGDYRVRVGGAAGEYALVLTRQATFDLARNLGPNRAQPLAGTGSVLGALRSGGDLLFAVEFQHPTPTRIHALDPATGAVRYSFDSPFTPSTYPHGLNLANDGESLWYNAGAENDNREIYRLDLETGEVLTNFTATVGSAPYGLGYVRGELFVAGTNSIAVYALPEMTFQRTVTAPVTLHGLAGDDTHGWLYGVSQTNHRLYRLDPLTGTVVASVVGAPQGTEQGLAVVGDELFVSETSGLSLNAVSVYDLATLTLRRRLTLSLHQMVGGLGGDGAGWGHWFEFAATTGDNLVIRTTTPAGEPQAPHGFANPLDPYLLLFAPNGSLVGSNYNGAADGKNALLNHTATQTGTYRVAIGGENLSRGEYLLQVTGATTGAPPSFVVTTTTPVDGANLPAAPTQLTVKFNRPVWLPSVTADDVVVDGTPATGWSVVDGRTIVFDLPPLGAGPHTVTVAAGALTDTWGTPLTAFTMGFVVDLTGPTVIASSPVSGASVPAGTVVVTVTFSEPIRPGNISSNVATLVGARSGPHAASNLTYQAGTATLTLTFTNLPQDSLTLTVHGGDGLIEDLAGNDLVPLNWTLTFDTDVASGPLPALVAREPLGSLVYETKTTGHIGPAGDTDTFTTELEAGQLVTVMVLPSGGLTPTLAVDGPSGPITNVTDATGGVGPMPVTESGTHAFTVGGAGTTGGYALRVILNGTVEREWAGGPTNDAPAAAEPVAASSLVLTGASTRAAVCGLGDAPLGPEGYGYRALSVPFEFLDISRSGIRAFPDALDGSVELRKENLGGFTNFNFYGVVWTNLFINSNGLITFLQPDNVYFNFDLTTRPVVPTIAPFWDGLDFGPTPESSVYWQVIGSKLYIQWHRMVVDGYAGYDDMTFQVVLDQSDQTIRFNYPDLGLKGPTGNNYWGHEGQSATVGIKDNGTQGLRRLLISYDSTNSTYVGTGLSILITPNFPATQGADVYALSLLASNRVSLAGNVAGPATNIVLRLLAGDGTVLASSQPGSDTEAVLNGYQVRETGTYYAEVQALAGREYALVLLTETGFDAEPNDTLTTGQNWLGCPAMLGWLAAPSVTGTNTDWYRIYLEAGETLEAATQTPGVAPGAAGEVLDLALELYDPSGVLVASDDNNAPDGRNAVVSHTTGSAGWHRLRVAAVTSTGEYAVAISAPYHPVPPTVTLTSPVDNTTFWAEVQEVAIAATAADSDGYVTRVEFLVDGTRIATDTTAPYTAGYYGLPGTQSVVAVGYDNSSQTVTSAPRTMIFRPSREPVAPLPVASGLEYWLYVGNFSPTVENLNTATPVASGVVDTFTLNVPGRATNDYFGLRFEGYFEAPTNGVYTFYTYSNEGSRLWLGDTLLVDNDGDHTARERSGQIGLKAGRHPILVKYYEKTAAETLDVRYAGPGVTKQTIPAARLSRALPVVTVTATTPDAREWGLVPGALTIQRTGNTNHLVTVDSDWVGTAAAGVDFTALPASITLSAGVTSVTVTISPHADELAEGAELVTLQLVTNTTLYAIGDPGQATVTLHDRPIDHWRKQMFGADANTPDIAGDLADADADGLCTLLEYAFGLNPLIADGTDILPVTSEDGFLTLTYRLNKDAVDITVTPEAGAALDLAGWDPAAVVEVSRTDHGDYWRIKVRDTVPVGDAPQRFLHLRVTR